MLGIAFILSTLNAHAIVECDFTSAFAHDRHETTAQVVRLERDLDRLGQTQLAIEKALLEGPGAGDPRLTDREFGIGWGIPTPGLSFWASEFTPCGATRELAGSTSGAFSWQGHWRPLLAATSSVAFTYLHVWGDSDRFQHDLTNLSWLWATTDDHWPSLLAMLRRAAEDPWIAWSAATALRSHPAWAGMDDDDRTAVRKLLREWYVASDSAALTEIRIRAGQDAEYLERSGLFREGWLARRPPHMLPLYRAAFVLLALKVGDLPEVRTWCPRVASEVRRSSLDVKDAILKELEVCRE